VVVPTTSTRRSGRALDRRIVALALPVLATLLADPLYLLTDTAILGHLGTTAIGGAAVAMVVLGLGDAVFIFLMFGTTASVSRLLGAGRADEAADQGVQAMWLGAGLGVVTSLVLVPLGPALLSLFGATGAVSHPAHVYFSISLLGLPAYLVQMAAIGALRGAQDTRTPLVVAIATVALNLVLEVVAIYALGFGVGASALGTVIALWVGAAVLATIVVRSARRRSRRLRPHPPTIRRVGATGWPLLIRTAALRGTLAVAVAVAGKLSADDLAAFAIAFGIWNTLAYVVDGLEVAAQALVAEALGRRESEFARRVGRRILGWALGVGVVCGVGVFALHSVLPDAFTADPAVRALAATSLVWVACSQPVNAVAFGLDGILVGAGDLWFLAAAMTVALAIFVPLALMVASTSAALGWLWAALVVFMLVRLTSLGARFATARWQRVGALQDG
jgi:putative MATE family efflux protein